MVHLLSRLMRKFLTVHESDVEQLCGDVAALASVAQEQTRLLTQRIEGARGSVKPEVLPDLTAYDDTLASDWRGVATDAALLLSLTEIDQPLHAEMAADMVPSDDEAVCSWQRDVQQIVALVEAARERCAAARAETDAGVTPPTTTAEIQQMVHHTTTVVQVANLVEGRPNPLGTPGPGHRHRAIAMAIRDISERHGGTVKTPLFAPHQAVNEGDDAPRVSPASGGAGVSGRVSATGASSARPRQQEDPAPRPRASPTVP